MRGLPALSMRPMRDGVLTLVLGLPRLGVLKALNNSVRNWSFIRSESGNTFISAKSKLIAPGPRIRFRGDVPKVPSAAGAKAEVLKYLMIFSARERFPSRNGLPTRSAKDEPNPLKARSVPDETENGVPLRNVEIPLNCHPPSM